jgi:hypothetical protein
MKSLQTLMAGTDPRIKADAESAQAEQGALPFEAGPESVPQIDDTADPVQPPKARAKPIDHNRNTFSTGSLSWSDLHNQAHYSARSAGVNLGSGSGPS